MEDLNYLFQREQVELHRAQEAPDVSGRIAHMALAQGYARRIRDHRLSRKAPHQGKAPVRATGEVSA